MIAVSVKLDGGIFNGDIPGIVEKQIKHEILTKFEERTLRQGKGLGAKHNHISHRRGGLELDVLTTLHSPRTTGSSWQRKNIGIIKSMAPRVGRKAMQRIVEELGT